MHGLRSRSTLVRQGSIRTASSAAVTKSVANALGKWSVPSSSEGPPRAVASSSNQADRTQPQYSPNLAKWARPSDVITSALPTKEYRSRAREAVVSRKGVTGRTSKPPSSEQMQQRLSRWVPGSQEPHKPPIVSNYGLKRSRGDKDLSAMVAQQQASHRMDHPKTADVLESGQQEQEDSSNSLPDYAADDSHASYVDTADRNRRSLRGRTHAKSRGSIVARLGSTVEIPGQSRVSTTRAGSATSKTKKAKIRELRPANVDVYIPSVISVENLARLLDVRIDTLQRYMHQAGMGDQASFDHSLTAENASLLALEFNRNPIVDDEAAFDIHPLPPHPDPLSLRRRPPVVTVMGHVDHGKTTLLDTLRSASVAKSEVGGITQHIGAFSVPFPSSSLSTDNPTTITFLDTPGHAAFSAMRARGANVTDIIVLVVAADDGVMPQTKEVIELIKRDNGKTGVVVAINKVDKPGVDIERLRNMLWAEGLQLETMGGDVPSVEISGLTGQGLDELVETISAVAELQDIRAERDGSAHGFVLESKVQKGLGNTATVLLLRGSLAPSSHIISGTSIAKVRHLTDTAGKHVKVAYAGDAVIVSGWKDLPHAGDEVLQGKEEDVKKAAQNRVRRARLASTLQDAEAINTMRRAERERKEAEHIAAATDNPTPTDTRMDLTGPRELCLVIKGDVAGSVEALSAAVSGIGNKLVVVKVVSSGVGEVTESDVMLAKAANGMIIAFSTPVSRAAELAASRDGVRIFSSQIIYEVLDEVTSSATTLLPVTVETRVTGEANVLQLFDIQVKGKKTMRVAGCRVVNGVVEKDKKARVVREGTVVFTGSLQTLRILKRDVAEVKKGSECGLSLQNFEDLRQGDLVQLIQEIEIPGMF